MVVGEAVSTDWELYFPQPAPEDYTTTLVEASQALILRVGTAQPDLSSDFKCPKGS